MRHSALALLWMVVMGAPVTARAAGYFVSEVGPKAIGRGGAFVANPDDPTAVERFKEASEAYAVLTDEGKRARYDQFGHAGVDGGAGVVTGDRQAQATECLKRHGLPVAHQRRRSLYAEHGQSGEPRLLLATHSRLHGGEPLDEARHERAARAPATSRG